AHLLIGDTVVAVGGMEARIPRRIIRLYATEERLKRPVEPCQHILQNLGVDVLILWSDLFDRGQLSALLRDGDSDTAFLPCPTAFLQGSVVELTATPQDKRHRPVLLRPGLEFVLVCLVNDLLFHATLFRLAGRIVEKSGAIHPRI